MIIIYNIVDAFDRLSSYIYVRLRLQSEIVNSNDINIYHQTRELHKDEASVELFVQASR